MSIFRYYEEGEYYLGPQSFPLWIRKLLPYNREFNRAAYLHDSHFGEGGKLCDLRRSNNVFDTLVIGTANASLSRSFGLLLTRLAFVYPSYKLLELMNKVLNIIRPIFPIIIMAKTYSILVRIFGIFYFNFHSYDKEIKYNR